MYSNVILPRQWPRLSCLCRSLTTIEGQKLPQNTKSSDGLSPPPRIPRGPTDILQALASTVGPDPTAAHYKYHDDPFLIPLSNFRKRSYALSAEAGRKAATWIRDEHADLFTTRVWDPPGRMITPHFNADPHIDAFAPKPIYNDESKVTEEDFEYTIKNALIEDSVKIFQLLGGADVVREDLRMAFLQLLCFYNEKEPDSMEWLEERWFSANVRDRQTTTWRLGGLADQIFASLEPKTSEAYCAIIQGMAKYYQAERAYVLCQEAREKGFQLSTGVYNALLGCVGFLKEGTALRTETLKNMLVEMDEQGISPNDETLMACLKSISAWGGGKMLQDLALQLVAEFKQLGIDPGLSAYYYLLCLFCKELIPMGDHSKFLEGCVQRVSEVTGELLKSWLKGGIARTMFNVLQTLIHYGGPRIDILSAILNDLESRQTLEAKEATDTNFFITAMGVCSDHLQDIRLAERLHALLMKGDNYKLVGDAYKESIYYRHFVTVTCRHAPFDRTTELLDTLVPNVYVPEPSVMEEIIKTLEVGGAGDRLAQTWSQLVVFGIAKRARLVEKLLNAMCSCYQYQDNEVKAKMRAAAADILKFGQLVENQQEERELRTPTQKLSASAMSNIIELCSDAQDMSDPSWDTVAAALNKLQQSEATGVPTKPEVLAEVAQKAAAVGKPGIAASALTYLAECGFEEAMSASVRVLGTMLNRSEEEVQQLLQDQQRSALSQSLHPSAMAVADAYHLARTGAPARDQDSGSSTSSESDSESSSDDEK